MVISVNEIIDNSINYNNYINEQDMFYEVQCILNEGYTVPEMLHKAMDAIFKFIKKILDTIAWIFSSKKKATADFCEFPITTDEIKNIDVTLPKYKEYENVLVSDPDFDKYFDMMALVKFILSDFVKRASGDDIRDFSRRYIGDVNRLADGVESMDMFKKFTFGHTVRNISELKEVVTVEYFKEKIISDKTIDMETYKKAKDDYKEYEKMSSRKDVSGGSKALRNIKHELENVQWYSDMIKRPREAYSQITQKEAAEFINILKGVTNAAVIQSNRAIAILRVKYDLEDYLFGQSIYLINKVKTEVLKLRGTDDNISEEDKAKYAKFKHSRYKRSEGDGPDFYQYGDNKDFKESSIYSNLKLI